MKIVVPILTLSALIASGVSVWSGPPDSGNLQVKMTVNSECIVNPTGSGSLLDFGATDKKVGDLTAQGAIELQCTEGSQFKIGLNVGKGGSVEYAPEGTIVKREMRNMDASKSYGHSLEYQLFFDAQYKKNVSITAVKEKDISPFSKTDSGTRIYPIYGRILEAKWRKAPFGNYSDEVTVSVTF